MLPNFNRYLSFLLLINIFSSSTAAATTDGSGVIKFQYNGYETGKSFITLSLGTPPQRLNVSLNFDSNIVWVISILNPYCFYSDTQYYFHDNNFTYPSGEILVNHCYNYGIFREHNSSTFQFLNSVDDPILSLNTSFNLNSSDLTVASGLWGKDVLHFSDGTTFSDFKFGLALSVNEAFGSFGISSFNITDQNSNSYNRSNLMDLLVDQNLIQRKVLAEYFRYESSTSFYYQGSLLIGGIDHTRYEGQLTTFPMINRFDQNINPDIEHLDITLSSFSLKFSTDVLNKFANASFSNQFFELAMQQLNITSETTFINSSNETRSEAELCFTDKLYPISFSHDGSRSYFPPDIYDSLLSSISFFDSDLVVKNDNYSDVYDILYNLGCYLSFNFSGLIADIPIYKISVNFDSLRTYNDMNDVEYNKTVNETYLNFNFRKNPNGDFFILGNFFLNYFYAVYDYDYYTISLAPTVNSTKNQFPILDEEWNAYINDYEGYSDADSEIEFDDVNIVSQGEEISRATKAKYYSNSYFQYITSYINITRYPATQIYTYENYTLYSSYTSKLFLASTPVGTYDFYTTTSIGNGPWTTTVTATITGGTDALASFKESIYSLGFTRTFSTASSENDTLQFVRDLSSGSRLSPFNFSILFIFAGSLIFIVLLV
ncbi:acid protease [Ascoidea rubescens DSM 1968]|uniref:Acid protease n=1 Tax=Ascoidea rubescens DSM 1968 TaxID=1344418 RepID=A0A1D2VF94_9ASCO|nr:acid protease [Ascoidea rubescens DSM 1968]ODV60279.1 acid protease [Ascoidea rubescens DSM 1968]